MQTRQVLANSLLLPSTTDAEIQNRWIKCKDQQRTAHLYRELALLQAYFENRKTDNLRVYVVILDFDICDRQSITHCARQISVCEVLCPTLCLYGCLYGCICLLMYYVCITWACIFVYVCYPLLEQVYWYVVLLCYICYTEFKKNKKCLIQTDSFPGKFLHAMDTHKKTQLNQNQVNVLILHLIVHRLTVI